jgi:AraC-like DNA-binding protein
MSTRSDAEQLAAVVVASLDESGDADQLARRAARSRTQFFRLFRALIDETPSAMRRRLRLERSAWQLGRTHLPVTEIAFDAGYGSLEAFTRAFQRAFRVSPSLYRRMGATYFHLPAPTSIHFCAPASGSEGGTMDLFDLFSGADSFHIRKLLEHSRQLTDAQLDAPLDNSPNVFPWPEPARSLRDLLKRLVQTKEIWTAAMAGGTLPNLDFEPPELGTPDALLTRLATADREFTRILSDVRNRNAWSDTFPRCRSMQRISCSHSPDRSRVPTIEKTRPPSTTVPEGDSAGKCHNSSPEPVSNPISPVRPSATSTLSLTTILPGESGVE